MPTYDFVCKKCGKKEEVFQKHDDPPPQCESHGNMVKELSPPTIPKGGGLVSLDVGTTPENFGTFK